MAVTLRSTTVDGATNKGSALTHEELDANFVFLQSGSGEVAGTVDSALKSSKTMKAWYVDSSAGLDSYSGRHATAPFLTIAKLLTQTIQPGDTIYLKRGGSWREKLTLPDDSITVAAYGDGADPILDGSDTISAGSWSKVGGLTNVYSISATTEAGAIAAASNHASVWVNGTRLVQASSAANCDATAGSYYPNTSVDTSPFTLYVHSTGSSDPRVDGKTYEYAKRSSCINTYSVENCVIRNVTTKKAFQSYGSLTLGKYCRAYDCTAEDGNKHNVFLRAYAECHRVTADDGYNADGSGATLFVHFESAGASETFLYEDCTAVLTTSNPNTVTGFYGHTSSGTFSKATYRRCTSTGCDQGYGGANITSLVYEDCDGTDFLQCFAPAASSTIKRGTQSTTRNSASIVASGTADLSITIDGIIASNNSSAGSAISANSSATGNTVTLRNCAISWKGVLVNFVGTTGTFVSLNNAFTPLSGASDAYQMAGNPSLTSDHNNFGGVGDNSNGPWTVGTAEYFSLEAYASATNQDTNSSNGNNLRSYERITLFDDFLGDELEGKWKSTVGSDTDIVAPAILADQIGGWMRFTTGNDAGNDMAANGVQFDAGTLAWAANQGSFVFETKIKTNVISNVAIFVGVTDQHASLEMPFTLGASDTLTSNATNAVGVLFDTGATTDNWWLVGVKADADATKQDTGVAPTANTFESWRVEVNASTGAAKFYRNGTPIGTLMSNAITNGTKVTPVIAAFSRNALAKIIDVDYVLMECAR